MLYQIPLSYNPIDVQNLSEVLSRYEGKHHNQIVSDFEELFKKSIGAPHAVTLNSGTSAIHLALKVLGVGPGDCVIVPTFTYVATVNPVLYVGAEPVFVDSEKETWNMDPALLDEAIKKQLDQKRKPKAIVVVHTYGMPANMNHILQLAKEYSIPVVEDAAESLGSVYHNKNVGLIGDIGIFSLNNNKVLTTYGGGILVTWDDRLAKRVRFLASQARESLPYYEHKEVGYNYAMSPLNAAYGLSQLPHLEDNIILRRGVFKRYREAFSGEEFQFQTEKEGSLSNRWFSTILFKDEATRLTVSSVLQSQSIETRPLWRPLHLQPMYLNAKKYVSGIAENLYERGLCLPSGNNLKMEEIRSVTSIIDGSNRKVTI